MSKKLMVIGAGISQLPTFEAAKRLGVETIAVDGNPNAPFRNSATYFECQDFKNIDADLAIALKYNIDGVVVPGTDFPVVGATIAYKLGLPGLPIEVAEICSDKAKQRKFLKNKGYFVPDFIEYEYKGDLDKPGNMVDLVDKIFKEMNKVKFGELHGGLVVKPVDSMAARGVKFVNNNFELGNAVAEATKFSRSKKVIIERFVPGMELSLDALVHDGKIYTFANADRHFTMLPYFIEIGHTMPTILYDDIANEAKDVFERAVKDLGITNGSAKGDIKITEHGIMIGEIAARISGGFLSGWTTPYTTGIYPHDDLVRISLGETPKFDKPKSLGYSAERVLLSIPGKLKKIEKNTLINNMGQRLLHLHVKERDELHFPENNAQRCGSAISFSQNRNESIFIAQEMIKNVFLRLEPNNRMTEDFLISRFRMFRPGSKEEDWHNVDIEEALNKVFSLTKKKNFEKVENFWKYFYAGGVQGGVYAVDTYGQ